MKDETQDDDRGQVGIGTLIVFIAMVLVAAIAAGVLINTAGFLQSKSEETGEQSGQQVTNRLVEVNSVGQITGQNPSQVGIVNVTVSKSPGADDIDLQNATVQWVDSSGTYDIVESNVGTDNADGTFAVATFKDADASAPVINDPDDRLTMVFDLGTDDHSPTSPDAASEFGNELERGETATLSVTTRSGATAEMRLSVPQSLSGTSAVSL